MRSRLVLARVFRKLITRVEAAQVYMLKAGLNHCGENVKLYPPVILHGAESIDIGDNTHIAPFVHVWGGGRVIIGANCMIGSHVSISSLTHDYTDPAMRYSVVSKPVIIEDDVWIGSHAVVLPGIRVGRGAVVGAHSLVTTDIHPYQIAYGIPARPHGRRPIENWNKSISSPVLDAKVDPAGSVAGLEHGFNGAVDHDRSALLELNADPDIGPGISRRALARGELPADGLFVGHGWFGFEAFEGQSFRWVDNDAEIVVTNPTMPRRLIELDIEPGPCLTGPTLQIALIDARGQTVASSAATGRCAITLPLPPLQGRICRFRLHTDGGGSPGPTDPRILNFRVFALGWVGS